jgi:hypothetical protein
MNFREKFTETGSSIMDDGKFDKLTIYGLIILSFLLIASCASAPPLPQLSEEEEQVKILYGNQPTTLKLYQRCKHVKMETIQSSSRADYLNRTYKIKSTAASHDANVVQIINSDRRGNHDLRLWSCPESLESM